jgi:hypothetical protein
MFNRPMLFVGVLAACAVVPYVLLDKNLAETARTQLGRLTGNTGSTASASEGGIKLPWTAEKGAGGETLVSAVAAPVATLEEAFRFDITPHWVTSRWPRVSTVLGEPQQLGMRVPLVSGTRPDDIAGSLTYYFDEHHRLQRITFYGMTGDEQRLLGMLAGSYRLKSFPTTDVARYIAGHPDRPTSSVTVRHLPVVRADALHARVELAVDLRRSAASAARGGTDDPETVPLPQSYRPW